MSLLWPQIDSPAEPPAVHADARPWQEFVGTGETGRRQKSASTGDPLVLGLPLIAVAACTLGLGLTGLVHVKSGQSPLAGLIAVCGIGLLLTSAWSASRRARTSSPGLTVGTPEATGSLPAMTVLSLVAAFFLSYATLGLWLGHGWQTASPSATPNRFAWYLISWIVLFALTGLSSVRIPSVLKTLLASFNAALMLLLVSTLGPSPVAARLSGVVVLVIGAAAGYLFLAVSGGKHPATRSGRGS